MDALWCHGRHGLDGCARPGCGRGRRPLDRVTDPPRHAGADPATGLGGGRRRLPRGDHRRGRSGAVERRWAGDAVTGRAPQLHAGGFLGRVLVGDERGGHVAHHRRADGDVLVRALVPGLQRRGLLLGTGARPARPCARRPRPDRELGPDQPAGPPHGVSLWRGRWRRSWPATRRCSRRVAALQLDVLGRHAATIGGVAWSPTLRQLEILVTLAGVGEASLDELHALVYGDRMVSLTTTKAEISHMRHGARWGDRLPAVPVDGSGAVRPPRRARLHRSG